MLDKIVFSALPGPDKTGLPQVSANQNSLNSALAFFFGLIAALAVFSIIIAGFNFVTSDGDAEKISRAKRTIILALVGLLISISAEVIVLTVLDRV